MTTPLGTQAADAVVPPAIPPRYRSQRRRSLQSRAAICEAVKELLSERRLDELTVNEIVERAEISRPTFYSHFETKYSVVAALVEEMGAAVYRDWRPVLEADGPFTEEELFNVAMATLSRWRERGALFAATIEGWHSDQEIHDAWSAVLERFRVAVTARVERFRPLQPDDAMTVPAMISVFERCVYLAVSVPNSPFGTSDEQLARVLASIWIRSLSGS
ncbi:TetR/AcrR family transcriptional regulator [Sporichthya polymorpha]|uniref:TetR/AcrR family transcriptional regulator n=1 Tax=Sporichthya polymorpha TaxID=35751 RepID=UPI0009FFA2A6|nr:TetR/AcrR family transcriptional regulator [Sporichthya polymorpha]